MIGWNRMDKEKLKEPFVDFGTSEDDDFDGRTFYTDEELEDMRMYNANNKPPRRDRWIAILKWISIIIILAVVWIGGYLVSVKYEIFNKGETGKKAVMYLYDYGSLEGLEERLVDLEKITTPEVYKKIAVTNSHKSLSVYLKFKKNPVSVKILEQRPGYILYTLETESLTKGRNFIFSYELDYSGKICKVEELEGIYLY